jgi:hypothetical protein
MSIFRAITAEEEAATAIFIALKEKEYDHAKKIKFKNHIYKQALEPFVRGICKFASQVSKLPDFPFGEKIQFSLIGEGKDQKLSLSFYYSNGLITAIPPLGFNIKIDDKPYHFEKELLEITSGQNKKDIIRHIQERSSFRNKLLYAQPGGIPKITGNIEGHLKKRQQTVIEFLRIYGLIYPYQEKALFVQQALNAFLSMMEEIEQVID